MPSTVLIGVFSDHERAEAAIGELDSKNYDPKEMSVILKDTEVGEEIAEHTGASVAEGAASGATTGGLLGGLAGLLVGVGALAIPGIGAIMIGGPVAAALGLTGAAATTVSGALTGALAGGLVGALVGWGVPKEAAEEYERQIKAGGVLLIVPVSEATLDEAREVFTTHGADQVRRVEVDRYDTAPLR
jgi:uncharacterized membrane protein